MSVLTELSSNGPVDEAMMPEAHDAEDDHDRDVVELRC